jgi:hypothetical protein
MSMRTAIIAISAFLLTLVLVSWISITLHLPDAAQNKMNRAMTDLGFTDIALPPPEHGFGYIAFKNIELDRTGKSYINAMRIEYDVLHTFLMGRLKSIEIEGLHLSGEMLDDGTVTLSGWRMPEKQQGAFQTHRIAVENGTISLLTAQLGGLILEYDLQGRLKGDTMNLRGQVSTDSKRLEFNGALEASFSDFENWQAKLEVDQAKAVLPFGRVTRVHGILNFNKDHAGPLSFLGELNAGGLTVKEFGLDNASITLDGNIGIYEVFADARAINFPELEVGLHYRKNLDKQDITGSVFAKKSGDLFDYLALYEQLPVARENLGTLNHVQDMTIDLKWIKSDLKYNIHNQEQSIDITGNILIKNKEAWGGHFYSAPLFLHDMAITQNRFASGRAVLSGEYSKAKEQATGAVKIEFQDGVLAKSPMPLKNIHGAVNLDRFETLTASGENTLDCALPLKDTIKQKCRIKLESNPGDITLESFRVELLGGTVSGSLKHDGTAQTLSIAKMDLSRLLQALGRSELDGIGRIKATLPLRIENGEIILKDAKVKNDGAGILKISNAEEFAFLSDDVFERETLAATLRNFHYSNLEIFLNGPVNGPLGIKVKALGTNPDIFNRRPVEISFETNAGLAGLFSPLFEAAADQSP